MSHQLYKTSEDPRQVIVLDVESGSPADLTDVGHERYARDPETRVWCVCFADGNGPVQRWIPGEPIPEAIVAAVADPDYLFVAHHATFEITIWQHILTPRHHWPAPPVLERWRCTQALALAVALPAELGLLARAIGLPVRKMDRKDMLALAKPRDPAGLFWNDDPAHLHKLYAYCANDVEVERALFKWLPPLHPTEQALWCLNERINQRGFYCDQPLIERALAIVAAAKQALQQELQEITRGEINTVGQRDKLLAWLKARGCELKDFEKATVSAVLRRKALPPECRRVLELRLVGAPAAAGKFAALQRWRCADGRVRGCFKYHGAATGRFSAGGPQPQNFRKEVDNIAAKFAAVMSGNLAEVQKLGASIEIVGDIARAAICAPPGSRLFKVDYSGIESRVLAWITGERSKLAQWAKFDESGDPNDDPYFQLGRACGFAEENARALGKVCDLAFGYGGGVGAFRNFCPDDFEVSDEQIQIYKQTWRNRHPQTFRFWYGINDYAVAAVRRAPETIHYGRFTLQCRRLHDAPFLFIKLPSGHELAYPYVKLITTDRGDSAITFMDNAIITGGWAEYRPGKGMWGGVFTENLTQAIARDWLAAAMLRTEAAGYQIVLHVHDEIVWEVPDAA
jgi:DNA polymerase